VCGKTVAGFAAFMDHLSYLPFSGSVLENADRAIFGGFSEGHPDNRPPNRRR
jgi:hypothetical protein